MIPVHATPHISLVVLSYNNWTFTYTCLTSLIQSFDETVLERGIEIIIVDNGSNSETRRSMDEFAKTCSPGDICLRFVMLEENMGYPVGINIGLAHCLGDFIGVLNNDLIFPQGWLPPLIQTLEADKLVGFAAPYLSYAPSIQHTGTTFASFTEMQEFAADFTRSNADKITFTDKVIGACLLFRHDLLASIGGNDFWYGIGNYDDTDWCIRARIAGYKVAVVGSSFVQHIGHASFRLQPTLFQSSLKANLEKFERKWKLTSHADPTAVNILNEIVIHTKFDRGQHYIPFRISDFSSSGLPLIERTSSAKRWLLCADWNSEHNEWSRSFIAFLLENEQVELIFWIPKSMFDVQSMAAEIQRLVVSSQINFKAKGISLQIMQDDIHHVDVLRLLGSTDAVVEVPGDFVNRYLLHLAGQIGMGI